MTANDSITNRVITIYFYKLFNQKPCYPLILNLHVNEEDLKHSYSMC